MPGPFGSSKLPIRPSEGINSLNGSSPLILHSIDHPRGVGCVGNKFVNDSPWATFS